MPKSIWTFKTPFSVFCKITKVFKKDHVIGGYASVEIIDSQNDLIPLIALKDAWGKYTADDWAFALVNVLHTNINVGKVIPEYTAEDGTVYTSGLDETGLFILVQVHENHNKAIETWGHIEEGGLKGFSIAGEALVRTPVCDEATGKCYERIDELQLHEISVVDRPANELCLFSIVKSGSFIKMKNTLEKLPMIILEKGVVRFGDTIAEDLSKSMTVDEINTKIDSLKAQLKELREKVDKYYDDKWKAEEEARRKVPAVEDKTPKWVNDAYDAMDELGEQIKAFHEAKAMLVVFDCLGIGVGTEKSIFMKPVPKPKKGEKKKEFISRCIAIMHKKDPDADPKQIAAMCYTSWRSVHGGKKPERSGESTVERLISDEVRNAMEKEGLLDLWDSTHVALAREGSEDLTDLYDLVLLRSGSYSKTEEQIVGDVASAPLSDASINSKEKKKVVDENIPGDNPTNDAATGEPVDGAEKSNELDAVKAITELGKKLDGFVNVIAAINARLDILEKPADDPPAPDPEKGAGEEDKDAGSSDGDGNAAAKEKDTEGSKPDEDLATKVADLVAKALEKVTGGESTEKKTHAATGTGPGEDAANPLTMDLKELSEIPMTRIMKGDF